MDGHLEWITYLTNSCLAHAPQRPPAPRTSPLPIDLPAGGRAHDWLAQGIAGYVVGCLGRMDGWLTKPLTEWLATSS